MPAAYDRLGGMGGYGWVSFTTDYGEVDGFVAACKGVIATIAPAARVIDVTHQVPPQDVRRGSRVLAQTAPWLPSAVHVAVVDPGVGTERRGVCVVAGPSVLIGPDNGLLVPAAEALGGLTAAYELTDPAYQLPVVTTTFHGRDVFAPAAAHVCNGVAPAALGPAIEVGSLVRLPTPTVAATPGDLRAEVLAVDGFGNVQLAAAGADLATAFGPAGPAPTRLLVHAGERSWPASRGTTFGDVGPGELVVYVDSVDRVAVAVNGGAAAPRLGAAEGTTVRITRA